MKIKNLRGLNPGIPAVSWEKVQEKFGKRCVLIPCMTSKGEVEFEGIVGFCQHITDRTSSDSDTHLFLVTSALVPEDR